MKKVECVHLQVRASPYPAPFGGSHWSEALALDGLGAASVVTVAAPLQGLTPAAEAPHASLLLSVTARQVPHSYCLPACLTHTLIMMTGT